MQGDRSIIVKGIRIEPEVLEKKAVQRCSDGSCIAICCTGGVWLRDDEAPRIKEWTGAIKSCLPSDRHDESQWFETRDDEVGTTTVEDPLREGQTCCVFLQPDRKCALQVISRANNLGWPGLKPYYCAIFPLYIEDDVLMLDHETPFDFSGAACRCSAPQKRAMYDLYRDEAILILGEDGYRELHEKASAAGSD